MRITCYISIGTMFFCQVKLIFIPPSYNIYPITPAKTQTHIFWVRVAFLTHINTPLRENHLTVCKSLLFCFANSKLHSACQQRMIASMVMMTTQRQHIQSSLLRYSHDEHKMRGVNLMTIGHLVLGCFVVALP